MQYILPAFAVAFALLLAACGKPTPKGEPVCLNSCRYPDGTFVNPPGSPKPTATRWDFQKFFWNNMLFVDKSPAVPTGHVMDVAEAATQWQTTPGDKIQWLGHSAFRYQISGTTILSDPLLTSRASPFQWAGPQRYVPSPLKPQDAVADLILITHNHYDHLDIETLKNLPNKDTVQVLAPLGVGPVIRETGIRNVQELDWHQSATVNGLQITLIPAVHFSARWLNDRNQTLWGGYNIKSTGKNPLNIYLSGDTTTHPTVFKQIGEKYGPFTHGLVSIGAYEPQSIMKGSHTTPEEAAQVGTDTKSNILIPHHWGTLVLTPEPAFEAMPRFKAAVTKQGYTPQQLWQLQVGETRPLVSR
ncbi:MAG: hydrolase [Alphaproteobacteria bacterium]|nr:MAG: hydrolase [Alphaproteobacteria bacterium]